MTIKRTICCWDKAKAIDLYRNNGYPEHDKIDNGVNYFVLMLEQLGATTNWSCEGHPDGFYIQFKTDYLTALKISKVIVSGSIYFTTELGYERNVFILRLPDTNFKTNREKNNGLRNIADAWEQQIEPLDFKKVRKKK